MSLSNAPSSPWGCAIGVQDTVRGPAIISIRRHHLESPQGSSLFRAFGILALLLTLCSTSQLIYPQV